MGTSETRENDIRKNTIVYIGRRTKTKALAVTIDSEKHTLASNSDLEIGPQTLTSKVDPGPKMAPQNAFQKHASVYIGHAGEHGRDGTQQSYLNPEPRPQNPTSDLKFEI